MEILHGIVQADQAAREDYDRAVARQASYETDLAARIDEIRQEFYRKADEETAAFEAEEKARADEKIAALDQKHQAELARARADFEQKKAAYAQRIFEIVVNQNA